MVEENIKVTEETYILPRNLEIAEISKVYRESQEFIGNSYDKFELDAGEVALIDTAGIQFLIQFVRSIKATGCELTWANDSIQIYQMADELGVADEFE